MSRKKQSLAPPKPPEFTSTPFSRLKGVLVASPPESPPEKPVVKQSPVEPADEESVALFLQAMAGTRPLEAPRTLPVQPGSKKTKTHVAPQSVSAELSAEERRATDLFRQEISRLKLEVKFTEQLPDEDELKALNGNRVKQLKRGTVAVDYQLDLHGLTRDEALAELPRFLRSARQRGQAAALVITGKGLNSSAEPVLQQAVAAWLRDAGRELVSEFCPAPREMGGSGAFVVFLRPVPKQSVRSA